MQEECILYEAKLSKVKTEMKMVFQQKMHGKELNVATCKEDVYVLFRSGGVYIDDRTNLHSP